MSTITPAAGYAVQSPFNTNPAYSGTFIPAVWSSKLNVKFYANTTFADVSNTNWEGDIKNMGDKVIINNIPTISINAYTIGQNLTYEVPAPNTIELQIDKGFYFGVNVSDVLEYQSQPNLMDMFTTDAANQMKIRVDTDCFLGTFSDAAAANIGATAGALSGQYNLGTDASPLDYAAASNAPQRHWTPWMEKAYSISPPCHGRRDSKAEKRGWTSMSARGATANSRASRVYPRRSSSGS